MIVTKIQNEIKPTYVTDFSIFPKNGNHYYRRLSYF